MLDDVHVIRAADGVESDRPRAPKRAARRRDESGRFLALQTGIPRQSDHTDSVDLQTGARRPKSTSSDWRAATKIDLPQTGAESRPEVDPLERTKPKVNEIPRVCDLCGGSRFTTAKAARQAGRSVDSRVGDEEQIPCPQSWKTSSDDRAAPCQTVPPAQSGPSRTDRASVPCPKARHGHGRSTPQPNRQKRQERRGTVKGGDPVSNHAHRRPRRRPRRRLSEGQERLLERLGPLDGQRVPGGCEHCDAYQTVRPVSAGMWSISIHHDDWCPVLAQRQETP
jgi:hypothetical protein